MIFKLSLKGLHERGYRLFGGILLEPADLFLGLPLPDTDLVNSLLEPGLHLLDGFFDPFFYLIGQFAEVLDVEGFALAVGRREVKTMFAARYGNALNLGLFFHLVVEGLDFLGEEIIDGLESHPVIISFKNGPDGGLQGVDELIHLALEYDALAGGAPGPGVYGAGGNYGHNTSRWESPRGSPCHG